MTETSYPWEGRVTGDAASAPYSSDLWASIWGKLFLRSDNEGILDNIDNELIVSGVSASVRVETGAALVDGSFYENLTNAISILIPTPVSDPRIDRIVLQKDWAAKTVRITRLEGTENASPTAPSLTQSFGGIWEIPLAQVSAIVGSSVIVVTDEREFAATKLSRRNFTKVLIQTIDGTDKETIDFLDIPDTFQHLQLEGSFHTTAPKSNGSIRINGDADDTNYYQSQFAKANLSIIGQAVKSGVYIGIRLPNASNDDEEGTPINVIFSNYKNTDFYKTAIKQETTATADGLLLALKQRSVTWINTDAINRLTVHQSVAPPGGGAFVSGTIASLYGIL